MRDSNPRYAHTYTCFRGRLLQPLGQLTGTGLQSYEYFLTLQPKGLLFEPFDEMVLGIEEIHGEADPAGGQDDDGGNDLPDKGDGLLDDVQNGDDRKDNTDDVNDACHNV